MDDQIEIIKALFEEVRLLKAAIARERDEAKRKELLDRFTDLRELYYFELEEWMR